eukprot:1182860-Prorocentrum_minimum.AAC.3
MQICHSMRNNLTKAQQSPSRRHPILILYAVRPIVHDKITLALDRIGVLRRSGNPTHSFGAEAALMRALAMDKLITICNPAGCIGAPRSKCVLHHIDVGLEGAPGMGGMPAGSQRLHPQFLSYPKRRLMTFLAHHIRDEPSGSQTCGGQLVAVFYYLPPLDFCPE